MTFGYMFYLIITVARITLILFIIFILVGIAVQADQQIKIKENKKKDQNPDFSRELSELWNINCNWRAWNGPQRLKMAGKVGNRDTNTHHPSYSIADIDQNTEKSPEDLRWFAATHFTVKAYQQTLVWKTH